MRRCFFIFGLVIVMTGVQAQRIRFSLGATYDTYAMEDMKSIQEAVKAEYPVNATVTDAFPNYYGVAGDFSYSYNEKSWLGIFFKSAATGGRVYYEDYSGKIVMDQSLNAFTVGSLFEQKFNSSEALDLYGSIRAGFTMSNFDSKGTLTLYDVSTDFVDSEFVSMNVSLAPGLGIRKYFSRVYVSADVYYDFNVVKGQVKFKDNKDQAIEEKIDWTGFRVGLNFGVLLN